MNLSELQLDALAEVFNIGVGQDLSIRELAELIARLVGFQGRLVFDTSKPDGTPRKLVDTTRINTLGWRPRIGLEEGIRAAYAWFVAYGAACDGADEPHQTPQ